MRLSATDEGAQGVTRDPSAGGTVHADCERAAMHCNPRQGFPNSHLQARVDALISFIRRPPMVNADAVSAERLMLTSAVGVDFRRCSRRVKMRSFTNGSRSKTTSKPSKLGASYSTQHPQLYRELTVTLIMTCAASHHCRHPAHCRCWHKKSCGGTRPQQSDRVHATVPFLCD